MSWDPNPRDVRRLAETLSRYRLSSGLGFHLMFKKYHEQADRIIEIIEERRTSNPEVITAILEEDTKALSSGVL